MFSHFTTMKLYEAIFIIYDHINSIPKMYYEPSCDASDYKELLMFEGQELNDRIKYFGIEFSEEKAIEEINGYKLYIFDY